MIATFTKREAEVFTRFMSVVAKKVGAELMQALELCVDDRRIWLDKKLSKANAEIIEWFVFNDWNLRLEWCNMSEEYEEDEDPDMVDVGVVVHVYYRKNSKHYTIRYWNYGKQNFDALIGTHHPCAGCNTMNHKNMVAEDVTSSYDNIHFCHECFAKAMKHTEDCCCCMENHWAVWYKLSCQHVLHKKCFLQIAEEPDHTRKCPLCREKTTGYAASDL